MKWSRNGKNQGMRAPRPRRPKNYQFHGTYNPVKKNDEISYSDSISFRHDVGPGRSAVLKLSGKWYFSNG